MNWLTLKNLLFTSILLLSTIYSMGQKNDSTQVKQNLKKEFNPPFVYVGLSVGASAYLDMSLLAGVQITERINIGFSGKYQYYSSGGNPEIGFSTHIYGGSAFVQTAIIKDFRNLIKKLKTHNGIYIHAEYELLNMDESYFNSDLTETNLENRFWLKNIVVGPGYINRFNNSSIFAMILWNVEKARANPYEYPQFKVGFTYGF
ncbi:MAG: hypothetical protein AB7S50_04775 [Bacteroidales bacterium]